MKPKKIEKHVEAVAQEAVISPAQIEILSGGFKNAKDFIGKKISQVNWPDANVLEVISVDNEKQHIIGNFYVGAEKVTTTSYDLKGSCWKA